MKNREKMDLLLQQIKDVNKYIIDNDLQDQWINFTQYAIDNVHKLNRVSSQEWDIMIPKEKEQNACFYLWCLRAEYLYMVDYMASAGPKEIVEKWLENTWVKLTLTAFTVASLAISATSLIACATDNDKQPKLYSTSDELFIPDWKQIYEGLES